MGGFFSFANAMVAKVAEVTKVSEAATIRVSFPLKPL